MDKRITNLKTKYHLFLYAYILRHNVYYNYGNVHKFYYISLFVCRIIKYGALFILNKSVNCIILWRLITVIQCVCKSSVIIFVYYRNSFYDSISIYVKTL